MASTSTGPPWRFSILSDQILPANDDPYSKYLEQLYDRINKYLEQKIIASLRDENEPEPIHLQSKTLDSEANFLIRSEQIDPLFVAGGIQDSVQDHPPRVFEHFGKVFSNFNGRVLLLGEPGAGKTITLLQHTRDLVVQRWQNSSLPLPILRVRPVLSGSGLDPKKRNQSFHWFRLAG